MSFHGGFLGCTIAIVAFALKRKIPVLSLGDLTTAVTPIGLFLGRLANFVNGELWGRPTDVPWAMIFPTGGPIPRHPSQLYEAALEGIAALCCAQHSGPSRRAQAAGSITGSFAIGLQSRPHHMRVFPRARPAARLSVGRIDHGNVALQSIDAGGNRHTCLCVEGPTEADRWLTKLPRSNAKSASSSAVAGPLPVAEYMRLCLTHPQHGYYVSRDPLGSAAISSPPPKSARCSAN